MKYGTACVYTPKHMLVNHADYRNSAYPRRSLNIRVTFLQSPSALVRVLSIYLSACATPAAALCSAARLQCALLCCAQGCHFAAPSIRLCVCVTQKQTEIPGRICKRAPAPGLKWLTAAQRDGGSASFTAEPPLRMNERIEKKKTKGK